ncbi:MAG: tRNA (N(6)-L-threonylcarbamoyladenosine(37)-C(2))-methylthiotransferase MtaB [Candidatus Marinimicrobia bacterium]|jgi:threonylcarbamoyladenosine tRNA methylthiotransferase MtaB|nr:tRNA (N(6)-L-threonylcarbamoyladenosine(37)-C(2))-methylthiotransferase MtaB [Candidatus Neomarinimicrobiota bacterium]MBT3576235.1 tRNA (N(6)-L-threonylcarbamoyladenosine(37)-C(2))-methylthiotransferase MtaB [Candidatus Neomarinimicrobiota bacterium]MBT3680778.1 tRNA (N(6)-L-threonylcarbamoyladenosine(37)-C(2))-methylthiotransferase MtaB [Candidatus Neomarinimicrobiota bacterium]MBT3950773.1 tRNA (N(6)-L-threonylcarbamoyladenosine(37)-C(2))-methylthiotransferase MtaB [Candidatus Neomarinimic
MNSRTKKVAFHTLGCKLNYAETSTISRQFEAAGYEKIDFSQTADLYVINTCSVTENADREFRKIVNKAKRLSPDSKVAVIGCYAQLRPENIVATSKVDVVLGMKEKFNLLQHLDFDSTIETPLIIQDAEIDELHGCTPSYSVGDRTRSFLKIQDGCDYPCTYCTIPLARGKSRSIDPEILVDQAQEIAERGVKEIVLTGVNVGDYRFGSGLTLIDLLKRLDVVEGIDRIRISSIEPNLLTDEIIDFVSKSKSILPHFHIPLQAGSDKILSLMKRRYGVELYKDRIAAVRSVMPDAGIGVDVIVGFPGESEVEFQETYDLIESLDISYLHVFTYSERPNTDAINMSGKVGMRDRKTRNKRLTQLSERKNQSFALRQLNQSKQVLLESSHDGVLTGMTENYLKVHIANPSETLLNSIVAVELTGLQNSKVLASISI